jgi:predicted GNAT family N-acyltransferase
MAHNHQDMAEIIVRRAADSELAELLELRREVFVREQGVPPEMEHDELDATAIHAVARSDGEVIATGRLILLPGAEALIGRMAVRSGLRRQGIGGRVLRFLEEEAKARGVLTVVLHAQSYVAQFYRNHGYREEGEQFTEAGIPHIVMRKTGP